MDQVDKDWIRIKAVLDGEPNATDPFRTGQVISDRDHYSPPGQNPGFGFTVDLDRVIDVKPRDVGPKSPTSGTLTSRERWKKK